MADSLFDNPKTPARNAKTVPGWVIDALAGFGIPAKLSRTWPVAKCWAIYYSKKEKADPKIALEKARVALARNIVKELGKGDNSSRDALSGYVLEAFGILDAPQLDELARVASALLSPPAPAEVNLSGAGST